MLDEAGNVTFRPVKDRSAVVSWARTLSPTFFAETIGSWSYENLTIFVGTDHINHADRLGMPNPFKETGLPNFSGTGFNMVYSYADNKRTNITQVLSIDQNFTKSYVGQGSRGTFKAEARGVDSMGQFYGQVIASLIQRAAILYDVGIVKHGGAG